MFGFIINLIFAVINGVIGWGTLQDKDRKTQAHINLIVAGNCLGSAFLGGVFNAILTAHPGLMFGIWVCMVLGSWVATQKFYLPGYRGYVAQDQPNISYMSKVIAYGALVGQTGILLIVFILKSAF